MDIESLLRLLRENAVDLEDLKYLVELKRRRES
jgi:hypothetical protein